MKHESDESQKYRSLISTVTNSFILWSKSNNYLKEHTARSVVNDLIGIKGLERKLSAITFIQENPELYKLVATILEDHDVIIP